MTLWHNCVYCGHFNCRDHMHASPSCSQCVAILLAKSLPNVRDVTCCSSLQKFCSWYILQNRIFEYIIWTADPFATKLGLMVHHHKVECLVKRLDCSVVVQVKVTKKFTVPVNGHLDNISSAAELSVTKLGMVRQHYGPESCKKIGLMSSSSWSRCGLIWSNMTVSTISAELLIFLQPDLNG